MIDFKNLKFIIGLGNKGKEYSTNRHNIGTLFTDYLVQHYSSLQAQEYKKLGKVWILNKMKWKNLKDDQPYVKVMKPYSFMNLIGTPIQSILNQNQVTIQEALVCCDELDLKFGKFKIKIGGSARGHNGIKSIQSILKTQDFQKLLIGVDRPQDQNQVQSYLLSNFEQEEFQKLNDYFKEITEFIIKEKEKEKEKA